MSQGRENRMTYCYSGETIWRSRYPHPLVKLRWFLLDTFVDTTMGFRGGRAAG